MSSIDLKAVLTADIVNSTKLEGFVIDALRVVLEESINLKNVPFSFYRGDSFQCYIEKPALAYEFALQLRTKTQLFFPPRSRVKVDLKIAIGIGEVETPVTDVKTAKGTAFILSGRGLDELEQKGNRLLMRSENAKINVALEVISEFTDYLFRKLTYKQVEILQYLLTHNTQRETASILEKSQSTVNKHIQAMGWEHIEGLMKYYNQSLKQISIAHE